MSIIQFLCKDIVKIMGSVLMIIFQYLLFHHYFPAVLDIDALGGLASQATALQVE